MQLIKGPAAPLSACRYSKMSLLGQPAYGDDCLPKQVELSASFQVCLLFRGQSISPSPWTGFKTLLKLRCCAKAPKLAFLDQMGITGAEATPTTENDTLVKKEPSRRASVPVKRGAHLNRKSTKRSLAPKVSRQETLKLSTSEVDKARLKFEQLGVDEPALFKYITQVAPANVTVDDIVNSVSSLMGIARVEWSEALTMLSKIPSLLTADSSKLKANVMFLMELGMEQNAISKMLSSQPAFLEYDLQEMRLVVDYLISVGISKEHFPRILAERPQAFNGKLEDVKYAIGCFLDADVPPDDLARLIAKVPELFSPHTANNLKSRLDFFKQVGLYGGSLGKGIARRPNLLNFDLESMKQSYSYLSEFLDHKALSKLICRFAEVLVIDSKRKMEPMVNYLLRLGVKQSSLGKVLLRRPQLLGYTIQGLEPTLEYLKELGVKERMLGRVVSISPQVLTLNCEEKLKPVIEYLRSIGLTEKKDMEMLLVRNAQLLCCSIEKNISPKFNFFVNMGLSTKDVVRMLVLFPSMFGQSIEFSLEPKYEFLVDDMKRSPAEIIDFPQYFGYSLEKRIKPRFERLKARGIYHISLPSMLACIESDFVSRYMIGDPPARAPYNLKKAPRKSKYVD